MEHGEECDCGTPQVSTTCPKAANQKILFIIGALHAPHAPTQTLEISHRDLEGNRCQII